MNIGEYPIIYPKTSLVGSVSFDLHTRSIIRVSDGFDSVYELIATIEM
jgi:hypothetical protein